MRYIRGIVLFENGTFGPGEIEIKDGIIIDVKVLAEKNLSVNERKQYIIPGLIDIHSHGALGADACDASEEDMLKMLEFQRTNGVTSYFPTTMTFPVKRLELICKKLSQVATKDSTMKGIYLEGPFISANKCGAQDPEFVELPSIEKLRKLNQAANGLIKVVAIAPEKEGALDCIRAGKDEFKFSVAHTEADYDTAMEAFNAGAMQVTHLYNAMPSYHHRNPGVIGAAADSENVFVELICDGNHLHESVVRSTYKMFGKERIILISDSMEATGLPDGYYSLGGQKVYVKNKRATLDNGTIAGSASTLYDCMKKAVNILNNNEKGFADVIMSCTKNPAVATGIYDEVGSLSAGKRADVLILDANLDIIEVITNNI